MTTETHDCSRYIRTTSLLNAKQELILPDFGGIRHISKQEALELAQLIKVRKPQGHSYENILYSKRAEDLSEKTMRVSSR